VKQRLEAVLVAELAWCVRGDAGAIGRDEQHCALRSDDRFADRASPALQLIGTPRKRTISAREVSHGRSKGPGLSAAGRHEASAGDWHSSARARRQDVATAQDGGGAAVVAWKEPETVSRSLSMTAATLSG
jgi:hypothetical protein